MQTMHCIGMSWKFVNEQFPKFDFWLFIINNYTFSPLDQCSVSFWEKENLEIIEGQLIYTILVHGGCKLWENFTCLLIFTHMDRFLHCCIMYHILHNDTKNHTDYIQNTLIVLNILLCKHRSYIQVLNTILWTLTWIFVLFLSQKRTALHSIQEYSNSFHFNCLLNNFFI